MTRSAIRSRCLGCAFALAAAAAAPTARAAVDLVVALTPATPPLANALVQTQTSSIFYDVTNQRSGTTVTRIEFRLPARFLVTGGSGPAGWTVTSSSQTSIRFAVASCGQGGLAPGTTGTFRVDATPFTGDANDSATTYQLRAVLPADPCRGTSGWTATGNVGVPLKMLAVTAAVSPSSGAAPLAATASFGVTNRSSASKTLTVADAVAPAVGVTDGGCIPGSQVLASGASGTFTCSYTLAPAATTSYSISGTVSGAGVSSGAVAGPVVVGPATAAFAFDNLTATTGDAVSATLLVTNNSGGALDVTPPTYGQLSLQNLAPAAGAVDPAPVAGVPAGSTQAFVYSLTVTGAFGASYVASGAATVTGGSTNLAVTPPGTVSVWRITWTPAAIVPARATPPYAFTVQITNLSPVTVSRVRISNPQNATWVGLANVNASGLTYAGAGGWGTTDILTYNGNLGQNASAAVTFSFTAIPSPPTTTSYPFQVTLYGPGNRLLGTVTRTVAVTVPIGDVASFTIQSTASGQTLYWGNTSRSDVLHDGVVVFRVAAPAVPPMPQDSVDYTVPANQPAGFLYADKGASTVATLSDPVIGAYNYRVCNHDANLIYSNCNSGFWNNAGWLDSAVAPVGGWTHQLGGAIFVRPGLIPGGLVGASTNNAAIALLDMATGRRAFPPAALAGLPSSATPALPLANGRQVLLAADQGGGASAIDFQTGVPYWSATKASEAFVAFPSATLWTYAPAAFRAAYATDVVYLGSTSGRLLGLDATTGNTMWTVDVGAAIRAPISYDYARNWLYVPTDAGLLAYDMNASGPTTPPPPAGGWVNPGGAYTISCAYADLATEIACADKTGVLRILDRATGAVSAQYSTGLTSPSTLVHVTGGFVISSATTVSRLSVSGTSIALAGTWSPGFTLAPVTAFSSTGAMYVGASDQKLHKLNLADASDTGLSAGVPSQSATVYLSPPIFDVVTDSFVFGASDGRLWSVRWF